MNLNQLAKELTMHEALKKQVNIAQMKEIIKVILNNEDIAWELFKRGKI